MRRSAAAGLARRCVRTAQANGLLACILLACASLVLLVALWRPSSNPPLTLPIGIQRFHEQLQHDDETSPSATFSSMQCTDGALSEGMLESRTCVFRNVCHGDGNEVFFYADPRHPQPVLFDRLMVQFSFPDYVRRGPALNGQAKHWAPTLVRGARPASLADSDATVAVLLEAWDASGLHSFLSDAVFARFYMQHVFGFDPTTRDMLVLEFEQATPPQQTAASRAARDFFFRAISRHAPSAMGQQPRVCYRNLIVGAGGFSLERFDMGASPQLRNFRDFVLQQAGIRGGPRSSSSGLVPSRHLVLLARGGSGPRFHNHRDLANHLMTRFGHSAIADLDASKLSVAEQVALLANSTALVSLGGAATQLAVFLPPGASSVVADVWGAPECPFGTCVVTEESEEPKSIRRGKDFMFTGRALYLSHMFYPVCSDQETKLSARSSSSSKPMSGSIAHLGDLIADVERMAAVVDLALGAAEVRMREAGMLQRNWHDPRAAELASCPSAAGVNRKDLFHVGPLAPLTPRSFKPRSDGKAAVHWVGPFLDDSGFGTANKHFALRLLRNSRVIVTLQSRCDLTDNTLRSPLLREQLFRPVLDALVASPSLAAPPPPDASRPPASAPRYKSLPRVDVEVRQEWPVDTNQPADPNTRLVLLQPVEYGGVMAAWVDAVLSGQVTEIWVPSSYSKQCFVRSGTPAHLVHVIPFAVDVDLFKRGSPPYRDIRSEKRFRFLYRGGLLSRKGIDVLLDAYLRAFSRDDDVVLIIQAVYGPFERERVTRLAASKGSASAEIEFIQTSLTAEDGVALLSSVDVMVAPFRSEGFGLHMIEAMATGLPVIVTGSGAALDFCDESLCTLIPSAEVECRMDPCGDHTFFGLPTRHQQTWAEPDVAALSKLMREATTTTAADALKAKADRAYKAVRERFSWDKSTRLVEKRLFALASGDGQGGGGGGGGGDEHA